MTKRLYQLRARFQDGLKRVFEKSGFCHISQTMVPHSSFQTAGANPGPHTVSLNLAGLFKHPLNEAIIRSTRISEAVIDAVTERERIELERRELAYRGHRSAPIVKEKTVILVDDGIATGSTMLAAVAALKQQQPARIVVASPTAPASSCNELQMEVNEVVVITTPDPFYSVGQAYEVFAQTSDEEVRNYLAWMPQKS